MSLKTLSTTRWRTRSTSSPPSATASADSPRITADRLAAVREPLSWTLRLGEQVAPEHAAAALARAARGPTDDAWTPPPWLFPHQRDAARRLAGILQTFGGALLADAVGLGKTYVALALASRYRRTAALVPASLVPQWRRVAQRLGVAVHLTSHERLSRGGDLPDGDLLLVDEAHRFRNPGTRRYDRLACRPSRTHLLLLTATPVVNRGADLGRLLALFLPDNALAVLGLPSLDRALAARDHAAIVAAAASVIVARSSAVVATSQPVPRANDNAVLRPPPLSPPDLDHARGMIETLQFPTLGDQTAAALLRLHLRYRLASSPAAFRETAQRHLRYLERALAAARRGEPLARGAARLLFGADEDVQLELSLSSEARPPLAADALLLERERVQGILQWLRSRNGTNPKAETLGEIIAQRHGRKTIVFTAAVATALDLARSLAWHRTAVVSGLGAWIASGRLQLEEALRMFAPRARGAPPPGPAAEVATLIATDLASEGLDLQDADAIVHYDLPWTPFRLEQRLGRIARLGSPHRAVAVFWFAPPEELERDLNLTARIAGKLACQLSLGVAASSRVGRARVLGQVLEGKERIAARVGSPIDAPPCFAVVHGPRAAAFAVRWRSVLRTIPELIVIAGDPPRAVEDPAEASRLTELLMSAPAAAGPPPPGDVAALRDRVRARLADATRGALDQRSRRLTRRVVNRAAEAARLRDSDLLAGLDGALSRLAGGVTEGAARALERAVTRRRPVLAVRTWLAQTPEPSGDAWAASLDAALLGAPGAPSPHTLSSECRGLHVPALLPRPPEATP